MPLGTFETVVNASIDFGSVAPNGQFYQVALAGIGHMLGIGFAGELPQPNVFASGDVSNTNPTPVSAEPTYPGDAGITLGQYLEPPDANDINMYKFNLASPGQLDLETFAQRLSEVDANFAFSQLDTVVSVYDSTGDLIAQR